jgi:GT2 family glycosyltransferase
MDWNGTDNNRSLFSDIGSKDYSKWIKIYEPHHCKPYSLYREKISVVIPVFNPNHDWLKQAVQSVKKQTYSHWELIIVIDGCDKFRKDLLNGAVDDPRISIFESRDNIGISHATNTGVRHSKGDYVAFLDQDDLLSPIALEEVIKSIRRIPDAVLIYSDEDKIDQNNKRMNPFFKPDFSMEQLRCHNYISHLTVIQKKAFFNIGCLDSEFDGCQDYDLVLKITEKYRENQIVHIKKILYHWRQHSASFSAQNKFSLLDFRAAILNRHIVRSGLPATVIRCVTGIAYPRFRVDSGSDVAIVIPTKNGSSNLKRCIYKIFDTLSSLKIQFYIVDNNSDCEDTLKFLDEISGRHDTKILRYRKVFNFSAICNFAAKQVNEKFIVFLNDDTCPINQHWLSELIGCCEIEGVGAAGPKLLYADGRIQHAGVTLGTGGVAENTLKGKTDECDEFARDRVVRNVSALSAACLAIRRDVFEELGGFDELNLPIDFSDVDLCLRMIEKGYRIVWTPNSKLIHYESQTRETGEGYANSSSFTQSVAYMKHRWQAIINNDPFYNPNLSLEKADFSLAFPPRQS